MALLVSGGVVRAWITINYLDFFYLRANRLFEGCLFEQRHLQQFGGIIGVVCGVEEGVLVAEANPK